MKIKIAFLCVLLSGCFWQEEFLVQQLPEHRISVLADLLSEPDRSQLYDLLEAQGIEINAHYEIDGYRLEIVGLTHQARDLYADPSARNLYLHITSILEAKLFDRERGELLWSKEFKHQKHFKPSAHFYSDQQWARAEILWDQQRIIFTDLANEIMATWKQKQQTSGNVLP